MGEFSHFVPMNAAFAATFSIIFAATFAPAQFVSIYKLKINLGYNGCFGVG